MPNVYDPREFVKKLTSEGMPQGQADVLASENLKLLAEQLPLKSDVQALDAKLDAVEAKLTARIDSVEAKLTARIDGLEAKFTSRIDGLESKLESRDSRLLLRLVGFVIAIEAIIRLL